MSFIVDELIEKIEALNEVDKRDFADCYLDIDTVYSNESDLKTRIKKICKKNIELKNETEMHDADADSFAGACTLAEDFIESIGRTEEFKKYKKEKEK